MIPTLIYLILKKLRKQNKFLLSFKIKAVNWANMIRIAICILVFLLIGLLIVSSQAQQLNYKVVRNGDDIGWMKLEKTCDGSFCKMILSSEIKFRMIILITATVVESSCFSNGKLIFSSQYHKTNGNVKVNKQTRLTGNGYEVSEDNEKEKLEITDVNFNLLCLYFQEPVAQRKVYCDKQQCFADIERTNDGGYKVRFPNGDSNCYYYTGAVCSKVKIEHTFYSAEIILNP